MYVYTELDPYNGEGVCAKTSHEKAMQRALLQYFKPQNRELVIEALRRANRHDLIGNTEKCIVTDNSNGGKVTKSKVNKNSKHTSGYRSERKGEWQRVEQKRRRKR